MERRHPSETSPVQKANWSSKARMNQHPYLCPCDIWGLELEREAAGKPELNIVDLWKATAEVT